MKFKMALTMVALAGALFAVTPASAAPVGAAGQSIKADAVADGLVEQVRHRRHYRSYRSYNRHAYRYRYRPYAYYSQPYYYRRPYYSPYYSSYYSPYYYGGYGSYGGYGNYYGRRRGGLSIQFGF
jgi:hypothetical protein